MTGTLKFPSQRGRPVMTTSPVERAADHFVSALAQWRVERGMTKKQLAARMGFDPSYVSHVEGRRHKPTEDFAHFGASQGTLSKRELPVS